MMRRWMLMVVGVLLWSMVSVATAQVDTTQVAPVYLIVTQDGGEFVGTLVSDDTREVVIETRDLGRVTIPKYQIKEMRVLEDGELSASGAYLDEHIFATRHFITTNGLPVVKGESYIQWNVYGPNFQFGIGERVGVGIITSWFGTPLIGTFKYSVPLSKKVHLGLGTLLGTGSWSAPDYGIAVPFAALTLGDRQKNLTLSAGYGVVWEDGNGDGRALLSVAGMTKVGRTISFVLDSIIVPAGEESGAVAFVIPGLRFQDKKDRAFQFGFAGALFDGEALAIPFPMVQLYRKF